MPLIFFFQIAEYHNVLEVGLMRSPFQADLRLESYFYSGLTYLVMITPLPYTDSQSIIFTNPCWPNVGPPSTDGGPTLSQHEITVSCRSLCTHQIISLIMMYT